MVNNFLDVWSKRLIAKAWEKREAEVKQIFLKDRRKIRQRQANTKKPVTLHESYEIDNFGESQPIPVASSKICIYRDTIQHMRVYCAKKISISFKNLTHFDYLLNYFFKIPIN